MAFLHAATIFLENKLQHSIFLTDVPEQMYITKDQFFKSVTTSKDIKLHYHRLHSSKYF